MRAWSIVFVVACGPIYKDPPRNTPQAPPAHYQAGPPGGGADPDPWRPPGPASGPPAPAQTAPSPPARPVDPPVAANVPPAMASLLATHNQVRAKHCAAPLTWSPKLAAVAQEWASSLKAQGCKFGHKPRNKYGENLAAGTSGTLDGEAVTRMWYDEVKDYKFPSGGFSMETGHFTQVVWRQTTQIGCAVTTCNGMDIWVCEYDPPGNVETMYRQNVLPAGCR